MTSAQVTAVLLLSLTLLTGCVNLPVASDLKSEARSGHGLLTARPRVSRTDNGLLVSGYVTRGAYYCDSARLHVDIEVLSLDGKRLAFVPARFFPNPIQHRRRYASSASYVERIAGDFPAGSSVRVTPHPVSLKECLASLTTQP